jgi:hypothetical protein
VLVLTIGTSGASACARKATTTDALTVNPMFDKVSNVLASPR